MKCPECHSNITSKKRTDTKFCSKKCKNDYHNKRQVRISFSGDKATIEEHIHGILDNRETVKALLEKNVLSTTISDLIMSGVNPFYYSKVIKIENTTTYYFFEYYYLRYGTSNAVELGVIDTQL